MERLSVFLFKTGLFVCALCTPVFVPAATAAPQWDYVYLSTAATPDAYPYGAWGQDLYLSGTDTIAPVNGRLHFNLHNDSLFFYWRGEQADPRISSANFTFEWRQEVLSPGNQFSMVMHYAETQNDWIELTYNWMLMLVADSDVVVLPEFTAGPHTYRLVKRDSQVELYADGALTATLPAGAYTVNQLELNGWGAEYAPYEAYWEHVAYTRGAYAPAELPSPPDMPATGNIFIDKRNGDEPLLTTTGVLSDPLVSYVTDSEGNAAAGVNLAFSISRYPQGATGQELTKTSELTGESGLADVRLKLGNIPAEYDVKAECQSCTAETSTVTFTCCGKVPNDHFSQGGQMWSSTCYANNNCQIDPDATIGWRGCALTSLATLINYYNSSVYSGIPRTNPGDLNTYLRDLPGYGGYNRNNDVEFSAIRRYSSGRVSFVDRYDVDDPYSRESLLDTADGLIRSGIPLMFRVGGPHFILVIGKCGSSFVVADPAGGREYLYNPANPPQGRLFRGLRVFSSY